MPNEPTPFNGVMHMREKSHVLVGFANPFLVCTTCKELVRYWHDPTRCKCGKEAYNHPCKHSFSIMSICPTWSPVYGCDCMDKEKHDKMD